MKPDDPMQIHEKQPPMPDIKTEIKHVRHDRHILQNCNGVNGKGCKLEYKSISVENDITDMKLVSEKINTIIQVLEGKTPTH